MPTQSCPAPTTDGRAGYGQQRVCRPCCVDPDRVAFFVEVWVRFYM